MSDQPSFFSEHPWITFFLGLAVVNGVVTVVRGYDRSSWEQSPRFAPSPQLPRLAPSSQTRGTYRP